MPALHVRNVDDATIAALKRRAASKNRSLEGELREILRAAAFGEPVAEAPRGRLRLRTVAVKSSATCGRDEIYGDDGR